MANCAAVVCSTSLELGIDIGAVDLVVMVSTPKGVSRAIQRIGRSGHSLNKSSHGVLVATNVNDLVEATVTAKLVRERALDPIRILEKPYDVVAQQLSAWPRWRRRGRSSLSPRSRERDHFTTSPAKSSIEIFIISRAGATSLRKQYPDFSAKSPFAMA